MDDLTEMAKRLILINKGTLAFDGDHQELLRLAGDKRVLKAELTGEAPQIRGAKLVARENGTCECGYGARDLSPNDLFASARGGGRGDGRRDRPSADRAGDRRTVR